MLHWTIWGREPGVYDASLRRNGSKLVYHITVYFLFTLVSYLQVQYIDTINVPFCILQQLLKLTPPTSMQTWHRRTIFWRTLTNIPNVFLIKQADEILGHLAEEASSRVELFCCTTMHVRTSPGRHKPCCVSNSIGTSSSILRTVRSWHRQTFSFFQKWRSTLLVSASQKINTWKMLAAATWFEEGIHTMVLMYEKWLDIKSDYVE